jgi:hypothetical protein
MFTATTYLGLSTTERADLEHVVRSTSAAAGIVQRARCVRLLADGQSYGAIGTRLGVSDRFIARWKRRYLAGGVLARKTAKLRGRCLTSYRALAGSRLSNPSAITSRHTTSSWPALYSI